MDLYFREQAISQSTLRHCRTVGFDKFLDNPSVGLRPQGLSILILYPEVLGGGEPLAADRPPDIFAITALELCARDDPPDSVR